MEQNNIILEQKIALNFLPGITPEIVKRLAEEGLVIQHIFQRTYDMEKIFNRNPLPYTVADVEKSLQRAREEIAFMEKHSIRMLFMHDRGYPRGLYEMSNPPICLFYIGNLNNMSDHRVSMVGTRKCTRGGMEYCERFVEQGAGLFPDLSIVSGLAYGIDAASHRAALKHHAHTMAVVAHGLDTIYPADHRRLALDILNSGGAIITEYPSGTTPYRNRFLERNRIVACISHAVIVVESDLKGGAMSTANTAFSYSRDVFAVPGRPTDITSRGCNHLIRRNKAHLTTDFSDFASEMRWQTKIEKQDTSPKSLFPELEGDARLIYDFLRNEKSPCSADLIHQATGLSISRLLAVIGELEFDGIVVRLPGNRFEV